MTPNSNQESKDFYGLGIAPKILNILEVLKFTTPTPIQLKSIPVTIEGKDIVGIAQTGTGKTLAFGIPMIQRLAQHKGRGLVLLPTRELAQQVDENLRMIGQKLGLRTAVLIGGEPIGKQIFALKKNPHIIVATPGRMIDHLQSKNLRLDDVKILILDEADMMFDMGFAPQIEQILKSVPKERQTMLFSATMPPAIMKIVTKHMALPISIEVAPAGTAAENVEQEMIVVRQEEKMALLEKTLKDHAGSVLVFSRTKHNAKKLNHKINEMGHKAAEIHSNRSLAQRREALAGFKNGRYRVLVATDIAARGIDVTGIELVLNYDLPDNSEDYVHRIGRTGRAGKTGKAISFVLPNQLRDVKTIEKLIKKAIPLTSKVGTLPVTAREQRPSRPQRGNLRQGGFGRPRGDSKPSFGDGQRRDRGQKSDGRGRGRDGGRGKLRHPANNDITSAFNPFKEGGESHKPFSKGRREGGRKFAKPGFKKSGRSGGRDSRSETINPIKLTDKQRFRRSMRGE